MEVQDQKNTKYYLLASRDPVPCFFVTLRPICYLVENDGFVTLDSAIDHYSNLGIFHYNHSSLLTHKDIFEKVLPIIR